MFWIIFVASHNKILFLCLGLGYGLGSMGGGYRDYSQDRELARDRSELEEARYQQALLEQRIAQLEAGSRLQQAPQALPEQEAPPAADAK